MNWQKLRQKLEETGHDFDWQLLEKAVNFAKLAKGEENLDHNFNLAAKLIDLKVADSKTIAVAILHDTEDLGAATASDLEEEFGAEVAQLIKSVAGLKIVKLGQGLEEEFTENLRKMFLAMAKDLRVILIKLADIFDNLENLQKLDLKTRKNLGKETLEIFAPLAGRLGIGELKGELEDLAFKILQPENYDWIVKFSKKAFLETDKMLLKIKSKLAISLEKAGITAEISGRKKHIYSLYKKLIRPEISKDLSKIYDLVALRIIVQNVEDCYKVLGLIHKIWPPLPNYVRDYIASPKPNGYQSLHTTVFGQANKPFEVQIRTRIMHEIDEFGVAAYWHYSEEKTKGATDTLAQSGFILRGEKLNWLKQLADWQKEIGKSQEFLHGIKVDFFADRVFVFTPKGDVKDLPVGATPVDFAYAVHTKVGDATTGAKVNGKMVPLDYKVKTGEVVEILVTSKANKKPSPHWLNFVVTTLAKKSIRKSLSK